VSWISIGKPFLMSFVNKTQIYESLRKNKNNDQVIKITELTEKKSDVDILYENIQVTKENLNKFTEQCKNINN
jgi:hypothetical protein